MESHPALLAARGGSAAFSCLVDTGLERLAAPQRLPASLWPSAHRPWRALLHFDCTLTDQLLLMVRACVRCECASASVCVCGRVLGGKALCSKPGAAAVRRMFSTGLQI